MMHLDEAEYCSRLWLLNQLPAGADVWVWKTNHVRASGGFESMQMPSGFTLRAVTHVGGYVRVGDQQWTLNKGDVFCAVPGTEICFGTHANKTWGWLEFQLHGSGAKRVIKACGMSPRKPKIVPEFPAIILDHFKAMHDLFALRQRQPHQALAILHQIIYAIGAADGHVITNASLRAEWVELACAMVESQATLKMNVNDLAMALKVDRVTLQRAFKSQIQTTPSAYLSRQRINRASELLDTTDWPLHQIAKACGYNDEKYLIRCFRTQTGKTPGQWRKR